MKIWLAAGCGAVVGAVVTAVLVFTLGAEDAAQHASASAPELTSADCLEIIPDSVFGTLGWDGQPATEDVGRCMKRGDEGYVSVGDRAVVGSVDERSAAAKREYDEQCKTLYDGSDQLPERDPDWLPEGTTACARLLPDNDKGNAALYLLTEQDEVVEIRLGALAATPEQQLKTAFAELVQAADRQW